MIRNAGQCCFKNRVFLNHNSASLFDLRHFYLPIKLIMCRQFSNKTNCLGIDTVCNKYCSGLQYIGCNFHAPLSPKKRNFKR